VIVAVLSDIHSNLPALQAVLAATGPVDGIWHLGDVVGYGAQPDEVVARLQSEGAVGVRGNHDAAAVGELDLATFNIDARQAMEWTQRRIDPLTRDWLTALPARHAVDDVRLVHGSLRDPTWEYITDGAVARASLDILARDGGRVGLHGHTHMPIAFRARDGRVEMLAPENGATLPFDERPILLNPGSVGQPRDGIPSASWMELDLDRRSATWRRVDYDIEAAQDRIRAAGLPPRLADRLAYGI
jgi:predicted phosphodiesterase